MGTLYRCQKERCPHGADPCELSIFEYETCTRTTPCPVGENDYFGRVDTEKEFFLLIVGSRYFEDYELLKTKTDEMLSVLVAKGYKIIVVSGGCKRGADLFSEQYAHEKGYQLYVFEADWNDGKSAGFKRNEKMHQYISKQRKRGVLAFWDGESVGTSHSFELAEKYGNSIKVFHYRKNQFVKVIKRYYRC